MRDELVPPKRKCMREASEGSIYSLGQFPREYWQRDPFSQLPRLALCPCIVQSLLPNLSLDHVLCLSILLLGAEPSSSLRALHGATYLSLAALLSLLLPLAALLSLLLPLDALLSLLLPLDALLSLLLCACSAEQQFESVARTNESGRQVQVQQVLYGGTRDGLPVGGARFYLGAEFIGRCPERGMWAEGCSEPNHITALVPQLFAQLASRDGARHASFSPQCTA